ncbi:uncharacterized protein LOC120270272 [Dioscorea cayenensis subsp. rotundata]|uniref:Uncharacterized protein LOC120270272 n=1 Tax=Dioscorea cayennensis subsp. rotundata TaxID=55577 RepID=A0AB40C1M4_DIOCR|nr:uncharacterized protein LOC120270272 [Dioscorea cayenensis subsp. rotundata]
MKEHLARKSGNILPCGKVPPDVRACIKEYITKSTSSKSKEKELVKEAYEEVEEVDEQDLNPTMKFGKRKAKGFLENFITSKPNPLSQPGLKSAMATKQAIHKADMEFAMWCFDACISFNAMRSPYFQQMLDAIGSIDILKDATNLCNLFIEIIEWVGPDNVVHLVTDNASNYVVVGRLIHEKYDHINWFPCAAHCLNLILKDIGKIDHVAELVSRASKIAPPIIRLLLVVDADEKPSLGYVYEGLIRIRKAIISIFRNKSTMYAAYFFNPAFLYDKEAFFETPEVLQGLLDLLEKRSVCSDSAKALREIRFYRDRLESFSRESAFSSANKMQPDEWWRLFGYSAPQLQKVTIRLLSQTASSSGCERNWSVFERIHTKKRNRLEHQRLSDLVFVNYNLRLKCRHQYKKRSYDSDDYDCIDKTDLWIVEEEEEAELVDGDMVEEIYGEDAIPTLEERHNQDDVDMNEEEVDIELFGHASYDDAFDQQEYLGQRDDNESWPQHQP